MTNPKPEKVAVVEDLERRLKESSVIILTDYRGLSVDEIGALRGRLREAGIEYRVAKNTLLALAAGRCGLHGVSTYLNGPTAAVFGKDDPGVPARLLLEFIRQYRKLEIKGAVIDGEALDADGVRLLASLPSRGELLARAIGMIQAPLRSLMAVLNGPASALVYALEALRARRKTGEGLSVAVQAPAAGEAAAEPSVSVPPRAADETAEGPNTAAPSVPEAPGPGNTDVLPDKTSPD